MAAPATSPTTPAPAATMRDTSPCFASGTAFGALLLGGVRIPINGDIYGIGIEGRYQFGVGDLPDDFVANRIDLAGGQFNVTFLVRF